MPSGFHAWSAACWATQDRTGTFFETRQSCPNASSIVLVGSPPECVAALGARIGLSASGAIENFWLLPFLQLGWFGFIPFVIAMGCMFAWCWRSLHGAMRLAVLLF